jgi:hypothetical protein
MPYLYIKQHTVTGKFYFGKTVSDPNKYNGSGKHWLRHLKVQGFEHVVNLWYEFFDEQEECTKFALEFSEKMDIVKSEQWLNLKPEDGQDGGGTGGTPEQLKEWRAFAIASPNHNSKSLEHLTKMRSACALSPKHNSRHKVKCPYCEKIGTEPPMKHWHFENCKLKEIENV